MRQLFIIGSPRSGTSAIAWALAQHPDLWTSAESDFLLYFCRSLNVQALYGEAVGRPKPGWLTKHDVDEGEFYEVIGSGFDQLFRSRSGGKDWIDQTPSYTLIANELSKLFPRAGFIHIVRDGRKVVKSMNSSGFEQEGFQMEWTTNFQQACRSWSHYARAGREFVEANPDKTIEVRNEDLLLNPTKTINTILETFEYTPHQAPADFLKNTRINSSYSLDTKPPGADSSANGWQGWSDEERSMFMRLSGKELTRLGYLETG